MACFNQNSLCFYKMLNVKFPTGNFPNRRKNENNMKKPCGFVITGTISGEKQNSGL